MSAFPLPFIQPSCQACIAALKATRNIQPQGTSQNKTSYDSPRCQTLVPTLQEQEQQWCVHRVSAQTLLPCREKRAHGWRCRHGARAGGRGQRQQPPCSGSPRVTLQACPGSELIGCTCVLQHPVLRILGTHFPENRRDRARPSTSSPISPAAAASCSSR